MRVLAGAVMLAVIGALLSAFYCSCGDTWLKIALVNNIYGSYFGRLWGCSG